MTHAIETTAHAELDNEPPDDYMIGPDLAGDRARGIAAIHAYADWLAAHPDVPMPNHLDGHAFQHGVERDASIATVRAFADGYKAAKHTSGDSGWAVLKVAESPLLVTHTVFTSSAPDSKPDWL